MDEEDDDFQYNNYEDEDDELFDQVNLDEQTLLKSNEVDNSAIIHENNNGNNNKSFLNDFGAAFAQFNQASQPVILPTQTPQSTSITTTTNTTTTTTTATTASSSASSSHILVHSNQRGNPILSYVKSVPWAYSHLVTLCDYQVGQSTAVLYLSLKYHELHPDYIVDRIIKLQGHYRIRILLLHIDTPHATDTQQSIRQLTTLTILNNFTLFLAWTAQEAGSYLETFKSYEFKPPDAIMERINDSDYTAKLEDFLTQIKGVNKTDVLTLSTAFGSLNSMIHSASESDFAKCHGLGPKKVARLMDVFDQPFLVGGGGGGK